MCKECCRGLSTTVEVSDRLAPFSEIYIKEGGAGRKNYKVL